MRTIKGARHAHAVIWASGRVPGEEARAVRLWYRKLRLGECSVTDIPTEVRIHMRKLLEVRSEITQRERSEKERRTGIPTARSGQANLEGI